MTIATQQVRVSESYARKLTENIRRSAVNIQEGIEKFNEYIAQAKNGNAHIALGYKSWTAYISDTLSETPMLLNLDARRALTVALSNEGMSIRAIAPLVGVSKSVVAEDLSGNRTPEPRVDEPTIVDQSTGEVIEPTIVEHTETVKTKTVTGLDGKVYAQQTALQLAESDPQVRDARYLAAFSKAVAKADDLLEFDPQRVGQLSSNAIESVEGLIKSMQGFLARMRPALRIVGGDR